MDNIVLQRMVYFCERNLQIHKSKRVFRKGRSTVDHIVIRTAKIEHKFARRKSVLATISGVKKAYDIVSHRRLLYRLKLTGFFWNVYNYIKTFFEGRSIWTRMGYIYSSSHNLQMGISQGSAIAPYLFHILLHNLPKCITKTCLWYNSRMICVYGKTSL